MNIQDVIVHLLLKQPFYGYIASTLAPLESQDTPNIGILLKPTPRIIYNTEWYENLKIDHAMGALIHELLHLLLLHPYRKGDRDGKLWAAACDMAVNEHIDLNLLPQESITVQKIGLEINQTLERFKSAEFYYEIISEYGGFSFIEDEKQISIMLKSGQKLTINNTTKTDNSEMGQNAAKSTIKELVEQAAEEGEIPVSINSTLEDAYKINDINWRNVLKRFLSGKGKIQIRKTCKRESKRFDNLPGNKRTVGTKVLLAIDESGSISNSQLEKFYGELLAIRKITGTTIYVTQFDTECTEPIPAERFKREKIRTRNGGTDFRPVFELADKIRIPLLIIFTDGDGKIPLESNQKVLWVLTEKGRKPADYGHSITLKL